MNNPGVRVKGKQVIGVGDRVSFNGSKGTVKSWVVPPARTPMTGPKGRLPNPSAAEQYRQAIASLRRILAGSTVNGVRLGDPGITKEWVRESLRDHQEIYEKLKARARLKKLKRNPGFFGAEAVVGARRVTKIRPVVDRETGERGEIVGSAPGGYVKVKWHGRAKSTLIKRSEIRRANPSEYTPNAICGTCGRRANDPFRSYDQNGKIVHGCIDDTHTGHLVTPSASSAWHNRPEAKKHRAAIKKHLGSLGRGRRNPGIMEIAGGLQALDYLSAKLQKKQKKNNPTRRVRRCDCENTKCHVAHVLGDCPNKATVPAMFGRLCDKCAKYMPAEFLLRKLNPTVREMSQRFQGKATGAVKEYFASDHAPRLDFSRAGKFIFLKLENSSKQLRIPGAVVTIDPKTEKLWIAGNRAPLFNRHAAAKGDLLDHGPVTHICYLTAKAHIGNGKTFEYVHPFGEEGGTLPHLCVDYEGMPVLRGGSYRIKQAGIVD